ncbi:MAG: hypothetical protein C4522_16015 [Desulfobacteraceae bacterium]|nr:MAG: hypothetical protein C4522_16015 [Desulfobacteraceae bacterium]
MQMLKNFIKNNINHPVLLLIIVILFCLAGRLHAADGVFNSNNFSSACSGSGDCYEVTSDASFDAVPWLSLGPGDTVRIHYRSEPYRKRIGLRAQGTSDQPVRIIGVKGPNGELPHLLGENATTPSNLKGFYDYRDTNYPGYRGLIIINAMRWGVKPSNIIIQNLKLSGANENNYFFDEDGNRKVYYAGAGGIYVYVVDNLTVRGCEIFDNGNGFYTRSTGSEETTTRNILFEHNYIYGNGNVGGDRRHNIYTESAGIIFQYNRIGRQRAGAIGSSLKDRSAGLIFRYNWIESAARTMDLVEAEDGANILVYEPDYYKTYVYGNIIINEVDDNDNYASAGSMIQYGADNSANAGTGQCTTSLNLDGGDAEPICRTGTLFFYNNTVIIKDYRPTPAGSDWVQTRIFELSIDNATADIRNNIFYLYSPNGSNNIALMKYHGIANLNGTNWINTGWDPGRYNGWQGKVYDHGVLVPALSGSDPDSKIYINGQLIQGTDPGFTAIAKISGNLSTDNYTPAGADLIDRSSNPALEVIGSGHNVTNMYQLHQAYTQRVISGSAMDLGALEQTNSSGTVVDQKPAAPVLRIITE